MTKKGVLCILGTNIIFHLLDVFYLWLFESVVNVLKTTFN